MFKKVLIAEDFDSINIAVLQALGELSIPDFDHAKYCDEALLKIKKSAYDNLPYDLLITDLSFLADGRECEIGSGEELIAAVKKIFPEISIIVLSVEDKAFRIRQLFDKYSINGFVFKGRSSIQQLKQAIVTVFDGPDYLSPEMLHIRNDKSVSEIDTYDISLLKLLADGINQREIATHLKNLNVAPNSPSAVEKRINKLKIYFRANNNVQIVAMAKDLGFI